MASSTDKGVKRTRDFYEGMIKRERDALNINEYFIKNRVSLLFARIHPIPKAMNTNEKVKNSTSQKYLNEDDNREGMSLHYHLKHPDGRYIPFIFLYEDSGGVYLKVPKDFKNKPSEYLQLLADQNYHILIVGKASLLSYRMYSRIIPIKDIIKNAHVWQWAMGTSKGNTNRMQFYGSISNIKYQHPETKSLFEGSLIEELQKLFQ